MVRNIFDSLAEKELYKGLHSKWKTKYWIMPHPPVSDIIKLEERDFTRSDWVGLMMSNFDFVVFDQGNRLGEALLVIEFDGPGHGYSSEGSYHEVTMNEYEGRSAKLQRKVSLCAKHGLPMVVVSFEENEVIDQETGLTILDGIIGIVVARQAFHRRMDLEIEEALSQGLSGRSLAEHIDMKSTEWEVKTSAEENPLYSRLLELWGKILGAGVSIFPTCERPLAPDGDLVGAEYRVTLPDGLEITKQAWVRRINCEHLYPYWLAVLIAEYRAVQEAVRRLQLE